MVVTNIALIDAYAQMAVQSYDNNNAPTSPVADFTEIAQIVNGPLGFQARAFLNSTNNELVIAFAGTEGLQGPDLSGSEFLTDMITNLGLAVAGAETSTRSLQKGSVLSCLNT